MNLLFNPRSIAVIGASRHPGKIGYAILKNILDSGYEGKIFPVNPNATNILGLDAYPSISSLSDKVDVGIVAVPAKYVIDIVEEAGKIGIRFLIIITAGFKEVGGQGIDLERTLISKAKEWGISIVGPNCLGIIDTYTPVNMTFSHLMPRQGNLAFISQSGALITSILDWSKHSKIGFSKIISIGNKALLDELDFIEYLAYDEFTRAILLYIESIDEGRRFIEKTRELIKEKPIIVLKGGVTEAGAKAAVSHTGSLAGRIIAYKAGFKKAGVVMASSLSELFDYALALANQPPPRRNGVAVVSNAGGLCILTADSLVSRGIQLANLNIETLNSLREFLPPTAAIHNPIDVVGDSDDARYLHTLEAILHDDNVDLVISALAPTALIDPMDIARGLIELQEKYREKGLLTCFVGGPEYDKVSEFLIGKGIPVYSLPERAASAVSGMVEYWDSINRPPYKYVEIHDVDVERVKFVLDSVKRDGRYILLENEAKTIAEAYGIPVPKFYLSRSPIDAVSAAEYIGYPVVLKIVSPDILHKTDVGGVRVGLRDGDEVEDAYDEIIFNVGKYVSNARIYGVLVEKMVGKGMETIIGVSKDLQFGHLMMFGSGGVYTELFKDVSFSLIPLSREEVIDLMENTKIYSILRGYRGLPKMDVNNLMDVLFRVNQLIKDFPEIVELDINPLRVFESGRGTLALDIKIVLSKEVI